MDFLETAIYRIILKTYMYMQETGRTESLERFPHLRVLTGRLTEETLEQWQQDNGVQARRYYRLVSRMNGMSRQDKGDELETAILCNVLDLCIAVMYVPEFAAYLNYYTGNAVTLQLAAEMEGVTYGNYTDMVRWLCQIRKACWVDQKKVRFLTRRLKGMTCCCPTCQGSSGRTRLFRGSGMGRMR